MVQLVGMVGALQGSVWLGTTIVVGPSTKPPDPITSDQVVQYGNVQGLIGPPILIKALTRVPHFLERLRSLVVVQWAGAPLEQEIGDLLKDHVQLSPAFGTTEAGAYLTTLAEDPADWAYYRFRPCQGIAFNQISPTTYELVFRKQASALWQQIFFLHPELTVYPTKDLFQKHPTKEGLWLYVGRTDDTVILANGHCLQASLMEGLVGKDPLIHDALLGGSGKERSFLLVEPTEPTELEKFWPSVEAANASCSVIARLLKELTIVAEKSKPFVRSGKVTVLRKETFEFYKSEIESAYNTVKKAG
jgi:acyl-coenzyme A synthetase/AMP-(fatty) acid ligase